MLPLLFTLAAASPVVAAVHYPTEDASVVDAECKKSEHRCAIEALVRSAAKAGAKLVVTPEYAFTQTGAEGAEVLIARFGRLADELNIYLVINLQTSRGDKRRNTQVAFDPDGKTVGRHDKFELFDEENATLTRGNDTTVFDTPFGRVGLLICADIYGDPNEHAKLTEELGATIVAISSWWTVPDATRWPAAFARDWNVHVVFANASNGDGRGSGVFAPDGRALATSKDAKATVVRASINAAAARRPRAPASSGR